MQANADIAFSRAVADKIGSGPSLSWKAQEMNVPASVAIIAMGASHVDYIDMAAKLGGRKAIAEETWAINAMGGVIQHDRAFVMDPARYIWSEAMDKHGVAQYREWLPNHPGPVYSAEADDRVPGMVPYPLEDVLNSIGVCYLNTTVAYALAYAIHLKIPDIKLFGCDFTYPNMHVGEAGRGNTEFLIALAMGRGQKVAVAGSSTLMDASVAPDKRLYAYERSGQMPVVTVEDGKFKVEMQQR